MRIEADAVLHYPRERVFEAYRDELSAFVDFLPNVRAIEVKERREDGSIVHLHNVWYGASELPAQLSRAIDARFLSWEDRAVWDERSYRCEWTIETLAFKGAIRAIGVSEFIELGDVRTRLEMSGELSIDLDRVRGLPNFVAGSLSRAVEGLLARQLTTNLASVSDALTAFLREDTVA